jgi:uncharacterized protein YqeY
MEIDAIRQRLQADLLDARKCQDGIRLQAIRSLLSALANAEAVPLPDGPYRVVEGGADVPRRALTEAEIDAVVRAEIEERGNAIDLYVGHGVEPARLLAEAAALERYLPDG